MNATSPDSSPFSRRRDIAEEIIAPPPGRRKRSGRIRWLIIGAVLLLISGTLYFFHPAILRGVGQFLIVDDLLSPSDAIVLSTGDLYNRPSVAARLYHQGYASWIMFSPLEKNLAEKFGIVAEHGTLLRKVLVSLGVPDSSIILLHFEGGVTSTFDEALSVRNFIAERPSLKKIIVVTSAFHTRRASLVYRKALHHLNVEVLMAPAPYSHVDVNEWWKSEDGLIFCLNEYVKLVYYWLKY